MENLTITTRKFIKKFNFPNPNWGDMPVDFPNLKKDGLTNEERCLLDAIVLAWKTGTKKGHYTIYKDTLRSGLLAFTILIFVLLGTSIVKNPEKIRATQVNAAATISATLKYVSNVEIEGLKVENLIESTMSAVRRAVNPGD